MIDDLSNYLGSKVDVIKDRVFEDLNEKEATKILEKPKGNKDIALIIFKISNFITSIIPATTSTILDKYHQQIKIKEADVMAEKMIKTMNTFQRTLRSKDVLFKNQLGSKQYLSPTQSLKNTRNGLDIRKITMEWKSLN